MAHAYVSKKKAIAFGITFVPRSFEVDEWPRCIGLYWVKRLIWKGRLLAMFRPALQGTGGLIRAALAGDRRSRSLAPLESLAL